MHPPLNPYAINYRLGARWFELPKTTGGVWNKKKYCMYVRPRLSVHHKTIVCWAYIASVIIFPKSG